jgi:anti-sigma factor ChrR (cupin superfamily)
MNINTDLTKRAVERAGALPWVPSPLPGVERRMLERDGGEVARVTTIVRYAPGSSFTAHTHAGGEEYLVLDGTFSDEHGDFAAGAYVRNPVGSRHAPRSEGGATILVKLWWAHPDDQDYVRIDTADEGLWQATGTLGIEAIELHRHGAETAHMYRLAPGAELGGRELPGGEELYVVAGACRDADGAYPAGTWLRAPIGRAPALHSDTGCRLFVKRGHLAEPPPGPPAP